MLYDIAFLIFSVFYFPTLVLRGKLHGNFAERFAIYGEAGKKALSSAAPKIWIQAVSVGEVALCSKLIDLLKKHHPDKEIVLSTITKAGNDLAKKLYGDKAAVIYFPVDFSFVVKRAVAVIRPKLYVMVETEIWPNLIRRLFRIKVPILMINGRISDRSFGKYMLARPFLKDTLRRIDGFCMQSALDAQRVSAIGAPEDKVKITGNMKFDAADITVSGNKDDIRAFIGLKDNEELFVAGSTHSGEEEAVIDVYEKLIKEFTCLRLLIAPRHIERAAEIRGILKKRGIDNVVVLDTIGKLKDIYSIATIVFIGGSLVRHGGQNPIEPAASGKAIIWGPNMFNFKEIRDLLVKNGGAVEVSDSAGLYKEASRLLKDEVLRADIGAKAAGVVLANKGASERNLKIVEKFL